MRILILGGTVFLGRALVEAALAQGDEISLFNRGISSPQLFPELERIRGDRNRDLDRLVGHRWDAVIDTSGYIPRQVQASASLLKGSIQHYTFISTLSVYANFDREEIKETDAVGMLTDPTTEQVTNETYGPLKAICELVAQEALPHQVLTIRPGLIVGPHDPTDRFTYWVHRVAQGGEVLAPGDPGQLVQLIDVRDLAEWNLRMIRKGETGVFNATGPREPVAMAELLEICKQVSGSDAHFTWVSEAFLLENQVEPWIGLPLWIPESDPESRGIFGANIQRALEAGLTFRSLMDTVRDTLAWDSSRPSEREWRAGITQAREADLLKAWKGTHT